MKTKRKRMGRPPLGDKARTSRVSVRVSRAELKAWRLAAKAARLSLSGWIAKPRRDEMGA